jgi:DNA-binding beta-propeller fold protein YncE
VSAQDAAPTGSLPKGVTRSPDGRRLYVTHYGLVDRNNIGVFDAVTLKPLGALSVPGVVVETAMARDGHTLYASNFTRGTVQFIDLPSGKVTREVKTGAHPKILVVSRDGHRLFAANWGDESVAEVDPRSGAVLRTLRTGKNPRGMAITRAGRLYVANFNGASLDVFDGPSLGHSSRLSDMCKFPRHLVLSPDDRQLYVSCLLANEILVLDTRSNKLLRRVKVGRFPKAIDVTPDGRYLVTADYRGSTTTVVDTRDWTTRTLDVPGMDGASGVVVAPTKRGELRYFVTGWYDNHLYAVGTAGHGRRYEVDAATASLTLMRRRYHLKHPVE